MGSYIVAHFRRAHLIGHENYVLVKENNGTIYRPVRNAACQKSTTGQIKLAAILDIIELETFSLSND